jgi:hypothetical protein
VVAIVDSIRSVGGRFLKRNSATKEWVELSDQQAKDKVGHAIRDAIHSHEERIRRSHPTATMKDRKRRHPQPPNTIGTLGQDDAKQAAVVSSLQTLREDVAMQVPHAPPSMGPVAAMRMEHQPHQFHLPGRPVPGRLPPSIPYHYTRLDHHQNHHEPPLPLPLPAQPAGVQAYNMFQQLAQQHTRQLLGHQQHHHQHHEQQPFHAGGQAELFPQHGELMPMLLPQQQAQGGASLPHPRPGEVAAILDTTHQRSPTLEQGGNGDNHFLEQINEVLGPLPPDDEDPTHPFFF